MESTILGQLNVVIVALGLCALLLIPIEIRWLRQRRQLSRRRTLEIGVNYSTFAVKMLSEGIAMAFWLGIYGVISSSIPWLLPTTPMTAIVAIVAVDFCFYWEHRIEHRVRILWSAYHSVHHSSSYYDHSTAFRGSFLESFVLWAFYSPLLVLGFSPALVGAAITVGGFYQLCIHTEMIRKLPRWLEAVLVTPAHHRAHHGSQTCYLDKNYGGILILWDKLFCTFQAEREPVIYGLTQPLDSANPIRVHLHDLQLMLRDMKSRSWGDRCRTLICPPEWKPSRTPRSSGV
jgi:sterol desaturase/sphingolipid hydroxylase (fatty acid hydroxylase superfamily)